MQKDVLFGLQQGTKVLQTINQEMGGIEGVERLMGETEEARAYQEVCSSFLFLCCAGRWDWGSVSLIVVIGGEPDAGGSFDESR